MSAVAPLRGRAVVLTTAFAACVVLDFLVWFHRATKNLHEIGLEGMRCSPRWAVGRFFVPLVNVFVPVKAMADVWRGSSTLSHGLRTSEWRTVSLSPMIPVWWGLHLLSGYLSASFVFDFSSASSRHDLGDMSSALCKGVVGNVANLLAAALVILLVWTVTRMQATMQRAPEALADVFA